MGRRTPLYDSHVALKARMVDFGGWDMPLHYGSQIEEHHAVRLGAGVFDVSHMAAIDLAGARTREFLRRLLANDVGRLTEPGKALYSCMLNDDGGVLDDLIVYFEREAAFRLVVNAGTADSDFAWLEPRARAAAVTAIRRTDLAILAVQGPTARGKVIELLSPRDQPVAAALRPFFAAALPGASGTFLARTGYTGEDGFEVLLPAGEVVSLWERLIAAGVKPCGLGARDTLRLEAGMNLYGQDMDATTSPLESGLAWTVSFDAGRPFIGRAALEAQLSRGVERRQVGLLLEDKGVLRAHQRVEGGEGGGEITSGTFSPTLGRSIALARVSIKTPERVTVDIRGRAHAAKVVKPPFVRHGRPAVS